MNALRGRGFETILISIMLRLLLLFEPKDIGHALSDYNWVNSMHEELENFEGNRVWELVDPPPGCKPIGTKWVWKTKREGKVRL
jgi:hypothetical protein